MFSTRATLAVHTATFFDWQGFMMVPRTFQTRHNKDALIQDGVLFKDLKEKLLSPDADYTSRAAHFLAHMRTEHEQKATISEDGLVLHTNGLDFKRGMVITLNKQRCIMTGLPWSR